MIKEYKQDIHGPTDITSWGVKKKKKNFFKKELIKLPKIFLV
jgi:hypothetical protein